VPPPPATDDRVGGRRSPPAVFIVGVLSWLPTDGVALRRYPGGVVPKEWLAGVEVPRK
jgi:hypothetical protein